MDLWWNKRLYPDSDGSANMFVELLVGVMASAEMVGLALCANIPPSRQDGVAGWDADSKRDRRRFPSPVGDDGYSVGDEKEVEDEEDARFDVSSAPDDVTSWRGLEA